MGCSDVWPEVPAILPNGNVREWTGSGARVLSASLAHQRKHRTFSTGQGNAMNILIHLATTSDMRCVGPYS